ncbi:conserved hypothetical protein [Vibrio nigripulchritudo MADA3029]|uniref:DUF465 domain-containing protein n=2 Tax=Vibrio nigripulchritudo TaxID=28173 RepID=U4K0Y5_9VIBR|nr:MULTISPECIES: YdcH family protein [Vibrio]EGU59749.1 hypothetical protein VINI7043_19818 [Vibrio nigripulchritudo ATCC 27043]KJY80020.1 hypothetical protein TW74_06595 [Vibrio nigripulchritudo]UAB69805.1 YdcH family protein [Vibrio sp. SCSIO 43132]CCN38056.1 conserved hypothetical protein [Vibrio nigripulchritudo AM115]CCN39067.1 conserved hypothetical protein [Vibrio nigripulchritudo FTn2]
MLGEDHSLIVDFPELETEIQKLMQSDTEFAQENKKYTQLDKEIRSLELRNAPIDDDEMHRMKSERAFLKDALYKKLTSS